MEQQMADLVAQVRLLTTQSEQHQRRAEELHQLRTADLQRMVELQSQVIGARQAKARVTFVDIKGIGKPSTFSSEPRQFGPWAFKLGNFLEGIESVMKDALEWAQDQETTILDSSPAGLHL